MNFHVSWIFEFFHQISFLALVVLTSFVQRLWVHFSDSSFGVLDRVLGLSPVVFLFDTCEGQRFFVN